jgi:hypothetical protein
MTAETCPHCGAERHLKYADIYECGTSNYSPFDTRSRVCHEREVAAHAFRSYEDKIAAQAAEIERLKALELKVGDVLQQAILNEREACAKVCEEINSLEDSYGDRVELICADAIRARGEVK